MSNMQMDPSSMIGQLLDDGHLRISQIIGSGSFATVYLAESTSRPIRHYAVKSLFKRGLSPSQLKLQQHELNFLTLVSPHPNIVTLHSALQDENFLHLVMEFAPNDLFDFIADLETMNDEVIKSTFQQIVKAVKHCHDRNIYHRDLKPENILVVPVSTTLYSPKITDFGLATQETQSTDFGCGSIRYLAPECLPNSSAKWYSPAKADIWALGIILVNLISGKNPWRRADKSDDCFKCYRSEKDFWNAFGVASEAQSLVSDILCVDPSRRIGLDEIEDRLNNISSFRDTNCFNYMRERESTLGTVVMEREHRSWNSWNSEMSFAHPLEFGDSVVPEEMRIRSPSLTFDDYDFGDEETVDDADMIIFPPMCDDEEEMFANMLVRGQVPSVRKTKDQEAQPSKKKRGKSKKPKHKVETESIEIEPHDNSDDATCANTDQSVDYFSKGGSASIPIAIPKSSVPIEGEKTPTGRKEVATMTESDFGTPKRWRKSPVPTFDSRASRGRSPSRTPPGKAMNPRSLITDPFANNRLGETQESFDRKELGGPVLVQPSNSLRVKPPAYKDSDGYSPNPSPIPLTSANTRNGLLTPVSQRYSRTPSPSGGNFTGRRTSPHTVLDRTPRKQDIQPGPASAGRSPNGRDEIYLSPAGYRNPVGPSTRTSHNSPYLRRSESGTRPTVANRPSTAQPYGNSQQISRPTPSAHRNQVKPFNAAATPMFANGGRYDVRQYMDYYHASSPFASRGGGGGGGGYGDESKWTKHGNHKAFGRSGFGGASTSRRRNDEWKKQEEWQPFGGLMEFGWDKYGKREHGRREWKKREVI